MNGGKQFSRHILCMYLCISMHVFVYMHIGISSGCSYIYIYFSSGSVVKESVYSAGAKGDAGSVPGLGKFPGGGQKPTEVFLPGESCGQRTLADYNP